jgi:hypothetical protein
MLIVNRRRSTERRGEGKNGDFTRFYMYRSLKTYQELALDHVLEVIVDETSGELVRGDQRRSPLYKGRCKLPSIRYMLVIVAEKRVVCMQWKCCPA